MGRKRKQKAATEDQHSLQSMFTKSCNVDASVAAEVPTIGKPDYHSVTNKFALSGQRCVSFFESLISSWRDHGSLPPLSTDETAMLSQLYKMWLESRVQQKSSRGTPKPRVAGKVTDNLSNGNPSTLARLCGSGVTGDSWKIALEEVKREHAVRLCGGDGLVSIVSQLDMLMKASEPTRTHAKNLLAVLSSPEMRLHDINFLISNADAGSTAHAVALGFIYDSQVEHAVGRFTDSMKVTFPPEIAALAVRSFQLYQQAATEDDAIGTMQLGGKYLRGEGTNQDLKEAVKWYTRSANLHNPIAQHKLGYFYDEGLPGDACPSNISEAIKWYTLAADFMPDSVHNLAKIYEDGRGGGQSDICQAVTMYSVAAARGFALSQVNLGRLFLLGEDGIRRDREAGKRLLTLAAESGDCDAQMVVGMIHATPAFDCFDLPLSEHWLSASVAGGKAEAEVLLLRVHQQMQHAALESITPPIVCVSRTSLAAKQRGDDYMGHGLAHAAALEYTRAFELDPSQTVYLVDRLTALAAIGQYEECLSEGIHLVLHWNEYGHDADVDTIEEDLMETSGQPPATSTVASGSADAESNVESSAILSHVTPATAVVRTSSSSDPTAAFTESMIEAIGCVVKDGGKSLAGNGTSSSVPPLQAAAPAAAPVVSPAIGDHMRLYSVMAESMLELHWLGDLSNPAEIFSQFDNTAKSYCELLLSAISVLLLEDTVKASKAAALIARITSKGKRLSKIFVMQGGVPLLMHVMSIANVAVTAAEMELRGGSMLERVQRHHGNEVCEEMQKIYCYQSVCINGSATLANLTRYLSYSIVSVIEAADGFSLLVLISCCKHGEISCEALQALGNVAVQATASNWLDLMGNGIIDAFVTVITTSLEDLGQLAQGISLEGLSEIDRETLWQDSFELLEGGISALGRVMEVCPTEFTRDIAMTSLMPRLQKIFRMDVLPSSLRSTTAFVLYNMTCARDAGAAKLLEDCVTRAAIRDILREHELSLRSEKQLQQRYPWTLEQLFAYVSRGLVVWASSEAVAVAERQMGSSASAFDRRHLLVGCVARIPVDDSYSGEDEEEEEAMCSMAHSPVLKAIFRKQLQMDGHPIPGAETAHASNQTVQILPTPI